MAVLKNRSAAVLLCISAVGVIFTAVSAARATPKAIEKMKADSRQKHNGDPYAYTKKEAVISAWRCYIPTAVIGASTIACIFGANALTKRQQAAVSSAYALLNASYSEYKEKVKELYGEEAHRTIVDSIAAEKAREVYVSANSFWNSTSLAFDERDPDDARLFYDTFSKRYFESTVTQVLEAEYHLNRNWCLGCDICVNDFYDFLGIEQIEGGNEIGWFWSDEIMWIDFDHHKTVLDDGLEVYVIDFVFSPGPETEED